MRDQCNFIPAIIFFHQKKSKRRKTYLPSSTNFLCRSSVCDQEMMSECINCIFASNHAERKGEMEKNQ